MRPLHGIEDGQVRRVIRDMNTSVRAMQTKLNSLTLRDIVQSGAIRMGSLSNRGSATDNAPGMYIVWEATYAELFVTFPTSASGDFDWLTLRKYTF